MFDAASSTSFSRRANEGGSRRSQRNNSGGNGSNGNGGISNGGGNSNGMANGGISSPYQGSYSGVSKLPSQTNLGQSGMSTQDFGAGSVEEGRGSPMGGGGSLIGQDEYTLKARALYSCECSSTSDLTCGK